MSESSSRPSPDSDGASDVSKQGGPIEASSRTRDTHYDEGDHSHRGTLRARSRGPDPSICLDLVGAAIHELKNLLNAILASTEACRLEVDEEGTAAQFLDRISEAADRGTSLTRNVLEKLAEEPERSDSADVVEVEPVVRETLELLAPLVPPDIHLEFEAWSEPMGVRLQREHLEEILFNLVQNALDAIEGEGRIAIRTSHTVLSPDDRRCALGSLQAGRYVEIVVEDTGEGMTSDVQEQVSHAFFTTRNDDSSGLGGWIVTRLVERWDGWIGYESEPGEGTTVSILLPRADTNRLDCSDSSSIAAAV